MNRLSLPSLAFLFSYIDMALFEKRCMLGMSWAVMAVCIPYLLIFLFTIVLRAVTDLIGRCQSSHGDSLKAANFLLELCSVDGTA